MALKAVFLDKDGTLVENIPYNVDPARIRLASGAEEALRRIAEAGYRVIVVSNQPGVALGLFAERELQSMQRHLAELVPLTAFYYCPHAPQAGCRCRKPQSGMLLQAAADHGVELRQSWMVGDILDDVEAGRRAGCRTVLVDNGNETEWQMSAERAPHAKVKGLLEAADLICGAA